MLPPKDRQIAAIMFTDIVGYTALMEEDEAAAMTMRLRHREVFKKNHDEHCGEIVQYFGDGTLSTFSSAVKAVECSISIQQALQKIKPVPLRIGLHLGDIVFDKTEVYGAGVNLASRIESLAVAGSVLLSGRLNDELENQPQITTTSLGYFGLKNIPRPIEVFAVANTGIKVPTRSELNNVPKKESKTIAVLPFANISADSSNEYFSDGMTEEIINALAKIKGLKVTSRTSSFYFKNKNIPISKIGQELNVSTILEGSIRLSGNKMRITAQLIDVADDFQFWSETFDRSIDDIFLVQDEVSLLIADKLREHVGHFDIDDRLVEDPELPVDTYKRYLKARYHLLKMGRTDIDKGLSILREVIKEQPDFALAHIGMHLGYTLLGTIGLIPADEAFAKGQPHLDRAIELDETLPECQLNLSYVCFLQKWDLNGTYGHLRKSFEIRPTVEYYQSMASVLIAEAKLTAGRNYIETALQLDPFSSINHHLKGFIDYCENNYDKAIDSFEKAIELKSDFTTSILYKGQALLMLGREDESLAIFKNLPADETGDIVKLGGMTLTYAAMGHEEKAEIGVEKLEAFLETDIMGRAMNLLILCSAMQDKREKTLDLIEKGVQFRLPMMMYLNVEPILKPLRPLPRFQALMGRILGKETHFDVSERKYQKPLFDKEQLSAYRRQLEETMNDDEPHLNPQLTLRDLAEEMEIPANHLSQLLNEGFNQNFSEFVNSYRLEAFKSKAVEPSQKNLTILALAYDSGFNSKTVFNTYFKKTMGITPRAYCKEFIPN